jgi:hypothetical protein
LADYDEAVTAVVTAGRHGPETEWLAGLERTIGQAEWQRDWGATPDDRRRAAFRAFVDNLLADELIGPDEEARLESVGLTLWGSVDRLAVELAPYRSALFIAMVNDGRLPAIEDPDIMLKRGEVVHLQEDAALLKQVVHREFQAGSRGMSFRVMKGVSYRVGATRGRVVETGRSWETDDVGTLSVTSQRLVFAGASRTVECAYPKLIDLDVYSDGIGIHVSNRQKPTVLRVRDGNVIAAVVNAAMQTP